MLHIPALIEDLALILAAAGVVTLLFRKFRQPSVLGYIIAGLLVGPHFPLFPTIGDPENIRVWAEIGVIFLLFSLGLEFSFKKLARVGGSASITAVVEVLFMILVGFAVGRLFGWSEMDSLFLGGVLSISSTTIIIRAFEEVGVKGRGFVSLVFGVLIVEDLIAILLLALLSTIAVSKTVDGGALVFAVIKLLFFLILWFLSGVFVLPTALNRLKSYLTGETLLIISIGLCFAMVLLATKAGFSPALGAFIMGSLLSETTEGRRIEHLIMPIKDLFAAIFFVSVGMLIEPAVLQKFAIPIIVIALATIVGKAFSTAVGVLISGRNLRHAVQSGLSLAQIGEFSFIIAGLGLALNVTSEFLYPVAVGVSAVTTFTTPYMIRSADRFYRLIDRSLPESWKRYLENYSEAFASVSFSSEWWTLTRAYSVHVIANAVLISAIFLGVSNELVPMMNGYSNDVRLVNTLGLLFALILSVPFFWAMVIGGRNQRESIRKIQDDNVKKIVTAAFEITRWLVAILLFALLSTQFVTVQSAVILAFCATLVFLVVFSRRLERFYGRIEDRFVRNLVSSGGQTGRDMPPLAPWDAHLANLEVGPGSDLIGKALEQVRIRERFGVTIALIERGERKIAAPDRHDMLFPCDKVFVIGTDEQIMEFKKHIEAVPDQTDLDEEFNYTLKSYFVTDDSPYAGQVIRNSGIREKSKGLVVGLEREGRRILNPDSLTKIQTNDVLWIVGESDALKSL